MPDLKPTPGGGAKARKRIPRDVQDAYGRLYGQRREALLFIPSGTEPGEARRLYGDWLAEHEGRVAAIRAQRDGTGLTLTPREARALAGDWYLWWTARHAPGTPRTKAQIEQHRGERDWQQARRDEIQQEIWGVVSASEAERCSTDELWERSDVRQAVRPLLADIGETAQFFASKGVVLANKSRDMFLDNLYGDLGAALRQLSRLEEGNYSPDTYPDRFPKAFGRDSGIAPIELFEKWAAARQPAAGTIESWKYVFARLSRRFPQRSAGSITAEEARAWIQSLITERLAVQAKGVRSRTARSVAKTQLKASKTVFAWALREKLVPSNPFADVPITVPKQRRQRSERTFAAEEWRTILSATLTIDASSSPDNAARRWVPWLCAYTGARVGEMTQLRGRDVIKREGIHALDIRPDAGTVKSGNARTVPLHAHLIEQGFLKFVARNKSGGPLFYNPAKIVVAGRKPRAVQARQRLATWVREIGVKDPELQPNHAWRHTFKQQAARYGITENVSDYITGHAPVTVARTYGAPTLSDMAAALKTFPRFEIGKSTKAKRDMAGVKQRPLR